ncbi:MAG: heavy-metal-associated domain-containing protein [Gammaproteobacteria bacterium]|nr:heavy-metal-associated domain-containing protein [Gammaproteobacteria bacterium]
MIRSLIIRSIIAAALVGLAIAAAAAGTRYELRVDGLACPFCVYGIERKLQEIDGVEQVDVDLSQGRVTLQVRDGVEIAESQMKTVIQEAGFTYRGMTKHPQ